MKSNEQIIEDLNSEVFVLSEKNSTLKEENRDLKDSVSILRQKLSKHEPKIKHTPGNFTIGDH